MKNSQRGLAPIAFIIIALLIAAGGGLYAAKRQSQKKAAQNEADRQSETEKDKEKDAVPMVAETVVKLLTQNDSGVWGSAVLTEVGSKTKVAIELGAAPKGVVRPAHIHAGSCAELGAVKYPLSNTASDSSRTMLDVSLDELLTQLPLAVNIHKSADEAKVYVACGDITNAVAMKPMGEAMRAAEAEMNANSEAAKDGTGNSDAGPGASSAANDEADAAEDAETDKMLKDLDASTNADLNAMMQ